MATASVISAQVTPAWKLVWGDEFEQADGSEADSSKWVFDLGGNGWGNNELQTYTDRRVMDNLLFFAVTPANLPGGSQWVFDQHHFLLLNVAVGGNWPGSPDAPTTFPQRMEVDYVRVYARTNAPSPSVQIRRSGGEVEVMWPGEFPNGRLFGAASFGQPWQEVTVVGVRQEGYWHQPVAPGFYRLAWLP